MADLNVAAWGAIVALWAAPFAGVAGPADSAVADANEPLPVCLAGPLSDYYQIGLVSTKRVPGTAWSRGTVDVTFTSSPFTVAVESDGSYRQDLRATFERLPDPQSGVYAVWVTTPQLDQVQAVGVLNGERTVEASVAWNQFIVVVSHEPSAEAVGERWSGPIVMRGLSRSGLMHTMAGHGPFQQENCATYGY